jgi:N-acetylmuramoyl-L-alanine amidase
MENLIKYITIHCSDSDNSNHDDIRVIDSWHRKRNFRKVGYNYFIQSCGSIQTGRAEGEILAHAKGHNKNHIAICLHGKNKFTDAQEMSLRNLIQSILDRHDIKRIYYHNEINKYKTCPNVEYDWIAIINEEIQAKEN